MFDISVAKNSHELFIVKLKNKNNNKNRQQKKKSNFISKVKNLWKDFFKNIYLLKFLKNTNYCKYNRFIIYYWKKTLVITAFSNQKKFVHAKVTRSWNETIVVCSTVEEFISVWYPSTIKVKNHQLLCQPNRLKLE